MLTCIACPQLQLQDEDLVVAATLNRKQPLKSLTTHIKDMAIKVSGGYKICKPCVGSEKHKFGNGDDNSVLSERLNRMTGRSNPMARDRVWGKQLSGRIESVILIEEEEPKEWTAQVEPGVFITFVSIPQGGNHLKGIRFSRELFNRRQAQIWWADNYEKVMELYNVQSFTHQSMPLTAPSLSAHKNYHKVIRCGLASTPRLSNTSPLKTRTSSIEQDLSSRFSISNANDVETELIEQDQPGVYITIRLGPNGKRELRRVRFSREKFGEMSARLWWEENKERIQEQYM